MARMHAKMLEMHVHWTSPINRRGNENLIPAADIEWIVCSKFESVGKKCARIFFVENDFPYFWNVACHNNSTYLIHK